MDPNNKPHRWYDGKIVEGPMLKNGVDAVKVHFTSWNEKFDAWVATNSNKIRPPCARLIADDAAKHHEEEAATLVAEVEATQRKKRPPCKGGWCAPL